MVLPLLKNGLHCNCRSVVSALAEVTLSYMHRWGVLQKTVIHLGYKGCKYGNSVVPEDFASLTEVI